MKIASDKIVHALAGGWIGFPVGLVTLFITGAGLIALLVATVAGGIVGVAWEAWQDHRNQRAALKGVTPLHTVEVGDVKATALGATIGACIAVATVLLIAWILP
jgi:hypothetical protein